jgi:uncharacterized protein
VVGTPHAFWTFMTGEPIAAGVQRIQVVNRTRASVLCTHLEEAHGPGGRARGLIGRDSLAPRHAMLFVRTRFEPFMWIHTMFMRFPIDVVFIDGKGRVLRINPELKPWRFSPIVFGARVAVELAAGAVEQSRTEVLDFLVFERIE